MATGVAMATDSDFDGCGIALPIATVVIMVRDDSLTQSIKLTCCSLQQTFRFSFSFSFSFSSASRRSVVRMFTMWRLHAIGKYKQQIPTERNSGNITFGTPDFNVCFSESGVHG